MIDSVCSPMLTSKHEVMQLFCVVLGSLGPLCVMLFYFCVCVCVLSLFLARLSLPLQVVDWKEYDL